MVPISEVCTVADGCGMGRMTFTNTEASFSPQLVRSLITIADTPEDGVVLDPMAGSGSTTPCEAIAFGRSALAADLNPLSVLISTVKASVPTLSAEGNSTAPFPPGAKQRPLQIG